MRVSEPADREAEVDRRRTRRFELRIPAILQWVDEQRSTRESLGFCRDISTSGLFVIVLSAFPALASRLDVVVFLPPLNSNIPAMQLRATGSVVRVEGMSEGVGVGIASRFGDFADSERPACSLPEEKTAAALC